MRTRRRFQPILDGLPYRIARQSSRRHDSGRAMAAPPASDVPTMTPCDSDIPVNWNANSDHSRSTNEWRWRHANLLIPGAKRVLYADKLRW